MIKLQKIQDLNYMNLKGTKFQIKVWNYLKKIPKGEVRTYLQVAKAIMLLMEFVTKLKIKLLELHTTEQCQDQ